MPDAPFEFLKTAAPEAVARALAGEDPAVVGAVLAAAPPPVAAKIMAHMTGDRQRQESL